MSNLLSAAARAIRARLAWLASPEGDSADVERARRSRVVTFFWVACAVWSPIYALVYWRLGCPHAGWAVLAAGAAASSIPLALKYTGSHALAANAAALVLGGVLTYLAALTGGYDAPALHWLVLVPVIVGSMGGWVWGTVWTAACVAVVTAFYLIESGGHPLPTQLAPGPAHLLEWIAQITLLIVVLSLTQLYESLRQRALRLLAEREAALRERNADLSASLEREQRTAEELEATASQLTAAMWEAEAATRAKSEFLANVSHELRTPLTAILGYTELLGQGCSHECEFGRARFREYAATVTRNSEYLLRIINDLLDLSKIEAGMLDLESIRFRPIEVLRGVRSLMDVRATEKGLKLRVECDGPIPETILSDPTRVQQILVNLVGNALKFTERGEVCVTARLRESDAESEDSESAALLEFEVRDTGIGMDGDTIERLFRPFTQADASMTRRFGGTGLGLTISRRIARRLGGDITVESEAGRGSVFRATVATGSLEGVSCVTYGPEDVHAVPEDRKKAAKAPACRDASSAQALGSRRVLLAEDGPDNRRLLTFILEKAGAQVTAVENGRDAVDAAMDAWRRGNPFDVILMDMQMPIMDGYEAMRTLRDEGYDGTIIALTAHAMASDRDKCKQAGSDDYATKPIPRERLIQMVRDARPATPVAGAGASD